MRLHIMFIYIIGATITCLTDILTYKYIQKKYAKKCYYDCSKCKNWKCTYFSCMAEKRKLENKEK